MIFKCPHRHVSYTTWRLRASCPLKLTGEPDHTQSSPSSHVAIQIRAIRIRRYDPTPKTDTVDPKSESRSHAFGRRSGVNKDADGGVTGRSKVDRGVYSPPLSTWYPQAPEGRGDIKDLLAELEEMVKVKPAGREHKKREWGGKGQPGSRLVRLDETIQSPLEKWSQSRSDDTKRLPTKQDIDTRLARNPWAKMLASPIRQCQATKARLPKDLLMTWGIIQNPANKLDYFLPVELSDVNALKEKMQALTAEDDQQPAKSRNPKYPEGERVYITPNKLATEAMTHTFVRKKNNDQDWTTISAALTTSLIPYNWSKKIEMESAFKRTERTVDPVTGTVMPASKEWKENVPDFSDLRWQPDIHRRIQHIMNERVMVAMEGIAEANLKTRRIRKRKVIAMDLPEHGRMRLVNHRLTYETDDTNDESAKYVLMDEDVDTDVSRSDVQESLSTETDSSAQFGTEASAQLDTRSPGHLETEETQATFDQNLPFSRDSFSDNRRHDWPSGSIFLHIGSPSQYVSTVEKWHASKPSSLPNHFLLPPTISINDNLRLPIFNILTLIGPRSESRLRSLTHGYTIFDYALWANVTESHLMGAHARDTYGSPLPNLPSFEDQLENRLEDDLTSSPEQSPTKSEEDQPPNQPKYAPNANDEEARSTREYMVLIKGTSHKTPEFIIEIWRLWRYIGGRRGLWLGDEIDGSMKRGFKEGRNGNEA